MNSTDCVGLLKMRLLTANLLTATVLLATQFAKADEPTQLKVVASDSKIVGWIRDQDGQGIAGAKLSPAAWKAGMTQQERLNSETVTDEAGYFEWNRAPNVSRLYASKFGYLIEYVETAGPRERNIVLRDAYKFRGVVLGTDGKPVVGAKVSEFQESDVASPSRFVITTDSKGAFEYVGTNPQLELAAVAENGEAGILKMASSKVERNSIQLEPTSKVSIRILDHAGNLVPGAEVLLGSWNKCGAVRWSEKSDEKGEVVWEKAPSGSLAIAIRCNGFRNKWTVLNTGDNAITEVNLYPPQSVACSAVDNETGEKIEDFIVTRRYDRKVWGPLEGETYPMGTLSSAFQSRGIIGDRSKDGQVTFINDHSFDAMQLTVHADGYLPFVDEPIPATEIEAQRIHRLIKKAQDLGTEIIVVGPDEKPVPGINVGVARAGFSSALTFDPDGIMAGNIEKPGRYLKTNSFGAFLMPDEPAIGTITAWGDAGWYFGDLGSIDPGKPLALESYCRIRIRFPTAMRQNRSAQYALRKSIELEFKGSTITNAVWIPIDADNGAMEELFVEKGLSGMVSIVDNWGGNGRFLHNSLEIASFDAEPGTEVLVDLVGSSRFSGNVSIPKNTPVRLEQLEIRATMQDKGQTKTYRSSVQSDGYFEFAEIPAGDYALSIPSAEKEPAPGEPPVKIGDLEFINFDAVIDFDLKQTVHVEIGQNLDVGKVEVRIKR